MIHIYFAPLQGYTEAPYRNAHAAIFGGIDTYYTPFVRIEKDGFRNKELRDIDPVNNSIPSLIPQLIASTPDEMKRIIYLFADKGYKEVDINMGCPFPLIAKKHKGSGILPYTNEIKALLEVTKENQYSNIAFSIKMRLGWSSPEESLALLPLLHDSRIKKIVLHPRLGQQQYKGKVDLEGFTRFYDDCRLPLIYNGDIETVEGIHSIASRYSKLTGIMIGRGLLANPALGWEYKEGKTLTFDEKLTKVQQFHEKILLHYRRQLEGGDSQLLNKMKVFWEYLLPEADRKIKKSIQKSSRMDIYERVMRELLGY